VPFSFIVGTGIFFAFLVVLRLVDTRNFDKIAVVAFWTYIFFSILQTPAYFPQPLNFEAIGAVSVAFTLVWMVYTKRATRSMLPPRGFWGSLFFGLGETIFAGLFTLTADGISKILDLILANKATVTVSGYPLFWAIGVVIVVGAIGLCIGMAFILVSDAVGRATGQWRIWIRHRKSQPLPPKPKTQEEMEDERIEKIIAGVIRRLDEEERKFQQAPERRGPKWDDRD
jgi:hypothetical protein